MGFPTVPGATTTIAVASAAVYFQCFPGKGGPDSFRGINGVSYVLKVNGTAAASSPTTTDTAGKVDLSAVVAQMQAGASVTLEIFGTTYDLTLVSTLDAVTTVTGQQRRLSMLGYELGAVDGVFAQKTDRATLNFQADMGLDPDGIIGNITAPQLTTAFGE
jgi:peptidoglycan hydrolase-like protein with peptidoglycan-binding domain